MFKKQHGMTGSPTWNSWRAMIKRCYQPTTKDYDRYGGRGITVCPRWRIKFENFINDMGERPVGKSLERIENNHNYCPKNCKWATQKEQARNRSSNHIFTVNGTSGCIAELADKFGINRLIARNRFLLGWTPEDMFLRPVKKWATPEQKAKILNLKGEMSQENIGHIVGLDQTTVSRIIRKYSH